MINTIDIFGGVVYNERMKSKDMYVKCRPNGELSVGRKVVSDLRFMSCISLHVTFFKGFLSCRVIVREEVIFMSENRIKTLNPGSELKLFKSTKVLAASALLIAMSIVLGKLLAINIGDSIRISFENLPIIIAGYFFGPAVGLVVGAGADTVGCLIVGYSINPIILVGAASIGFFAGLMPRVININNKLVRVYISVFTAHIIGSMIIKSLGMRFYFHTPYSVLAMRIPLYIAVGIAEGYVVYLLRSNKYFMSQLERVTRR